MANFSTVSPSFESGQCPGIAGRVEFKLNVQNNRLMVSEPEPSPIRRRRAPEALARLARALRRIAVVALQCLMGIPLLLLALVMLFGPPVSLIWETIDLIRMRARTAGRVETASVQTGGHGTARPNIEYRFNVNGREVRSSRYAPGFVANWIKWSGGARPLRDFPVGRQVTVYFSHQEPQRCALEYGWFFGSVGMTTIFGGFGLQTAAVRPQRSTNVVLKYAGQACVVYGFALLFLGPPVVRVLELPWHLLAWSGALGVALLNALYGWRKSSQSNCDSTHR